MKGYRTTFLGLFDTAGDNRPAISAIEIPIMQRDFAQGRPDDETTAIRGRFLDAIVQAVTTDEEMGLDFIYGDVKDGLLRPLDGQQRLTTLFLFHWYIASRARALDPAAQWLRFSYATRPTARDFCETIAGRPYPGGSATPTEWITDQPWYVYPWRQDPTISSMLVMVDAIHERFNRDPTDFPALWDRLSNRTEHAIWFLFLPVDLDYGEDLYIKMNSRGKPLTSFEIFKAGLESALSPILAQEEREHLTSNIDGAWTDTLWEYEKASGGDFLIDDEFMRYLTFIIDICDWRDGQPDRRWHDETASREWPLEERARLALADPANPHAARNRDFFFHAFDTWTGVSPAAELSRLFSAGGRGEGPLPLLVSTSPDLFGDCIAKYGPDREFSFAETLILFAVLLARQANPPLNDADLRRRLRTLRNLAESASLDTKQRATEYVAAVERLMTQPQATALDAQGFNQSWTADEKLKWQSMDAHPEVTESLHRLEDIRVIRGRLLAFDLDADTDTIEKRAKAFVSVADPQLRDAFGAALLTKGDYSRDLGWHGKRRQLGSSAKDDSWRDLLTTGSRKSVTPTRVALMALLDDVIARTADLHADPADVLHSISDEWLQERQSGQFFDWRYYLVRYPGARSSSGEGYYHNEGYDGDRGGFSYRRLLLMHGGNFHAYYSDALLLAAWTEGDLGTATEEPRWWHIDDPGLTLKKSHIEIRCDDDAYEIVDPEGDAISAHTVAGVLQRFQTDDHGRVLVQQRPGNGWMIDTQDRIQLCVRLVRELDAAGL